MKQALLLILSGTILFGGVPAAVSSTQSVPVCRIEACQQTCICPEVPTCSYNNCTNTETHTHNTARHQKRNHGQH